MKHTAIFLLVSLLVIGLVSGCSLSEPAEAEKLDIPEKEEDSSGPPKYFIDLEIKPIDTYVRAGEIFEFSTRATSRGSEQNFQVKLHHEVRSKEDNSILVQKDETIGLETIASKRTELIISKNAKPGQYVIETTATYESGSADSSFEFDIEPAVVKTEITKAPTPTPEPSLVQTTNPSVTTTSTPSVVTKPATEYSDLPASFTGTVHNISLTGLGYEPLEITIKVGDAVKWTNEDENSHTATGAGFDVILRGGDSGYVIFNETRVYSYSDTFSGIHPGVITVE